MIPKSSPLTQWTIFKHNKSPIKKSTLNLYISLFNGQSFTWKKTKDTIYGTCNSTFYEFKYTPEEEILYRTLTSNPSPEETLKEYFHLDLDYSEIFSKINDDFFKKCFNSNNGLRVLRQNPWECFVSFLCSQNNNIKRITMNVDSICSNFGSLIYEDDEKGKFYSFPSPEDISKNATEKKLRDIGLGYRAKYLIKSSQQMIQKGGISYLKSLREKESDSDVRKALVFFTGIGPKVADCISLYSLDRHNYVPIDTHMIQIYEKVYKKKKPKSTGGKGYEEMLKFFQDKLECGGYAGIAHSFLFSEKIGVEYESLQKKEKKNLKRVREDSDMDIKKELKRSKENEKESMN